MFNFTLSSGYLSHFPGVQEGRDQGFKGLENRFFRVGALGFLGFIHILLFFAGMEGAGGLDLMKVSYVAEEEEPQGWSRL